MRFLENREFELADKWDSVKLLFHLDRADTADGGRRRVQLEALDVSRTLLLASALVA